MSKESFGDFDASRKVDDWIYRAYQFGASDIHIEPQHNRVRVRIRVDGKLREIDSIRLDAAGSVMARLKIMGDLKIDEKRLPQDGRAEFEHRRINDLDLRISTNPTLHGEKIVLRLIDKSKLQYTLSDMGFSAHNLKRYRECLSKPNGLILHVGPTGSGKTTTLYTALQEVNNPDKNIHTVEDPIEYTLENVSQTQVNHKIGLPFPTVLRALLRQDPDVILIGEIRDLETAKIAVEAAMTGHLILSTLHTNDAVGTIARLREMGIAEYFIAYALQCVVSQRFVAKLCSKCCVPEKPGPNLRQFLPIPATGEFFRAEGCRQCDKTGYKGRMVIMEVLRNDENLRRAMYSQATKSELQAAALRGGMIPLVGDGVAKAAQGLTSLAEVLRVTGGISGGAKQPVKGRDNKPTRPSRSSDDKMTMRRPINTSRSSGSGDQRRVVVRKPSDQSESRRRVVKRSSGRKE